MACSTAQRQIATAIKEIHDLPEAVKEMFLIGLPNAFGPNAHQYQKDFASMLRKGLDQARASALEAQAAKERDTKEAQTVLEVCQADMESKKAAEDAARAVLTEKLTALEEAQAKVKAEEVICAKAEGAKQLLSAERQRLESEKAEVESVKSGSLRMLMDGGWEEEEVRDACIDAVCHYLQSQGSDAVLLAALPKALKRKPAECGPFDKMAVDEAFRFVSAKVDSLEAQLAAGQEELDDAIAVHLGAWAILDVAGDKVSLANEERDAADAAVQNAVVEEKLAASKVMDQDTVLATILSEATLLQSKAQQLDLALNALSTLEAAGQEEDKENAMVVDVQGKGAPLAVNEIPVAVTA